MSQKLASTIYFDNAATTSPLPCVVERLNELTTTVFGNPNSAHRKGRQAQEVLDQSQEAVARYFDIPPTHVIFTSGGTESNNLAIWGALGGVIQTFNWLKNGAQGKLITTGIEHDASKKVFESFECMGATVGWLNVNAEGLIELEHLDAELEGPRVRLVSIHHAQNEIGVVQDVRAISQRVRAKHPDAIIHIDGVQSFLKMPVNFEELGVDLISVSGHKIGGPKGIGALILGRRFENRTPKIGSLIAGSPQQSGIRPGTVPVPAIGALVSAIDWGFKHFSENHRRLLDLRERLISKLPSKCILNGPADTSRGNTRRVPQTVNFSIPGLPSAVTIEALSSKGICVSAGSACHSANPKPNETLMAMSVGRERALSSVRASFSSQNTLEEVDTFVTELDSVIRQYM